MPPKEPVVPLPPPLEPLEEKADIEEKADDHAPVAPPPPAHRGSVAAPIPAAAAEPQVGDAADPHQNAIAAQAPDPNHPDPQHNTAAQIADPNAAHAASPNQPLTGAPNQTTDAAAMDELLKKFAGEQGEKKAAPGHGANGQAGAAENNGEVDHSSEGTYDPLIGYGGGSSSEGGYQPHQSHPVDFEHAGEHEGGDHEGEGGHQGHGNEGYEDHGDHGGMNHGHEGYDGGHYDSQHYDGGTDHHDHNGMLRQHHADEDGGGSGGEGHSTHKYDESHGGHYDHDYRDSLHSNPSHEDGMSSDHHTQHQAGENHPPDHAHNISPWNTVLFSHAVGVGFGAGEHNMDEILAGFGGGADHTLDLIKHGGAAFESNLVEPFDTTFSQAGLAKSPALPDIIGSPDNNLGSLAPDIKEVSALKNAQAGGSHDAHGRPV